MTTSNTPKILQDLPDHIYANAYIYDGLRTAKHYFRFTVDLEEQKIDDILYTRDDYNLVFYKRKRPFHEDKREGHYFFRVNKQKVYFRLLKGASNVTDNERKRKRSDYL